MIILIVGAGTIAREYIKVVEALGHQAEVVGRGQKNIQVVNSAFPNVKASSGGLKKWLESNKPPEHSIVATPIENLPIATKQLLQAGCTSILVEKPLTHSKEEAGEIAEVARKADADISIAFNRRNYVSVIEAKKLIEKDGGVSSFHFDFTEATFRIDPVNYSEETNRLWGIANSSHVIDTAFYLGGTPDWFEARQYGKAITWHPAGSIFTGLGETENGVPFTYHSNWGCPGKWNIEIMTPERKLLFSPMERLQQQPKGGFNVELVDLDYSIDKDFKPGYWQQVTNWLYRVNNLFQLNELKTLIDTHIKVFNYR